MNPKLMPLAEGWYALHVRPRAERAVAQFLDEKGYETFLPTYAFRHRWSDRVKVVHQPLFPAYPFRSTITQWPVVAERRSHQIGPDLVAQIFPRWNQLTSWMRQKAA